MKRLLAYLCPLLLLAVPATASLYTSATCGTGIGNIPDMSGSVPGSLACGITVASPGSIAALNAVTVGLLGMRHEASGDLIVTLSHYTDNTLSTLIGTPQYVFYQIGKLSANPLDFGYLPQFGDSLGAGDNYSFNSGFTHDLWGTAALLGTNDTIIGLAQATLLGDPSLSQYWSTSAFSGAPNTMSSAFTGQAVAGFWLLNITDNAVGPTAGSAGDLVSWNLDLNTVVPEPGQAGLVALAIAGAVFARRNLR